jgi:cell division protein FtsI/penicillin-binding protein 2
VRQVCSEKTAQRMTEAMEAVVVEGTGKKAAIEGVRVAGKTGTAQRFNPLTKKYQQGHFTVSFVGFAPAEAPKAVAVIIIDDPKAENKSDLYGGKLAAPLFSKVMKNTLELLNVNPVASAPTQPGGDQ